nr:immunoglobulin light chain junction region [Macaca mulatta]MOX90448.1 immunoglobulin light chain junction region [Macaca mulatta]MOX91357.1 immunoglobulin light chain junction region [Macaca mulatta]
CQQSVNWPALTF